MPFGLGRRKQAQVPPQDPLPTLPVEPSVDPWETGTVPGWSTSGLIRVTSSGAVLCRASSVAEAKLIIKDLKLQKRLIATEKKQVNAVMATMRAEHRTSMANRGPSMRGGGGVGKFIRDMDAISRSSARSRHANALVPYQRQKDHLDRTLVELDSVINQLDAFILREKAKT